MIKRILLSFSILTFQFSILYAQAPRSYTSSEILLQLKKLNTVGSVLYIAAHPDDENTRLIAYLANEKCLRTGYLALTRGDGGQNLIGSEQGVELGIIRTQELLAARRIDGAEQFFTRAYDFGFSKTPKETFEKWNHDSVLADVVWVIRNFRPDIIITRFATDGSGGHGHHTASAILAEEAFDAAADPKRFPEQLKYVDVWQTRRMFYNSAARFFNPNADLSKLLKLDVGGYNALLGKSYGEIAAESRSMHRSQGFGSAKQRGESFEYFKPIKGDTANIKDIFDGIDFSWKRINGGEKIGESIDKIIKDYKVDNPNLSVKDLLFLNAQLRNSFNKMDYKREQMDKVTFVCAGLFTETIANSFAIAKNDSLKFSVNIISRENHDIKISPPIINFQKTFEIPHQFMSKEEIETIESNLKVNQLNSFKKFGLPKVYNENLYWLENGIRNNLFSPSDYLKRHLAQKNSGISYTIDFNLSYLTFEINNEINYKWVDPSRGELYRPLVITPPVMITLEEKSIVFADEKEKEVKVIVKAGKDSVSFSLKGMVPENWQIRLLTGVTHVSNSIGIKDVILKKKGEEKTVTFYVTAPSSQSEGMLNVIATVDGIEYSKGIKEIKYDHIPIQTWFPDAEAKLVKLDIKTKSKHIVYIPGAGDEVIPCLQQLGYEVTTLTDDKLSKENLSQFDAIITGVRAYNTNEKLSNFKQKLMDYVSNGGNLIVQYNTNNFISQLNGNFGPYPFKVTRDRVTDENAKVNFELPNHPVLNTPNKITDKDFEGWIQERCIYTASDSTGKYEMPLSMADENEKPNKGSLIISKYGKGNFIYTGLVFFRELPAGVPGAYRLFVNMIELGK